MFFPLLESKKKKKRMQETKWLRRGWGISPGAEQKLSVYKLLLPPPAADEGSAVKTAARGGFVGLL